MGWDFATDPGWQEELDWARAVVDEEIIPLEAIEPGHEVVRRAIKPIQQRIKERGLWAANLGPELGGQGLGEVKLALLNEVLGGAELAALAFGNQPPDSGNIELLASAGSVTQKEEWLRPLLDGDVLSAFAMTEQGTGSDPRQFTTRARREGDEWVIEGEKWFVANAGRAAFQIVTCVTAPDAPAHDRQSLIIVPGDAAGLTTRPIGLIDDPTHRGPLHEYCAVSYDEVRVPASNLLGPEGAAFSLTLKKAGPSRLHHFMRWMGIANRAFDDMCERAISIEVHGGRLADKQFIQEFIATSAAEISSARLLGLRVAWMLDRDEEVSARADIAMLKYHGGKVMREVLDRAIQVHGSLGVSTDMPLARLYAYARTARLYDGPDEVHKVTAAKLICRGYETVSVPSDYLPRLREEGMARYGSYLNDESVGGLAD